MINNNNIYINILSRDGENRDKLKLMDIRDMGNKLMAGRVKVLCACQGGILKGRLLMVLHGTTCAFNLVKIQTPATLISKGEINVRP